MKKDLKVFKINKKLDLIGNGKDILCFSDKKGFCRGIIDFKMKTIWGSIFKDFKKIKRLK